MSDLELDANGELLQASLERLRDHLEARILDIFASTDRVPYSYEVPDNFQVKVLGVNAERRELRVSVTLRGSIQNVCIQGALSADPKPVRACPECRSAYGHLGWCQSKGYSNVGPHPDAPAPETQRAPAAAEPDYCCGGTCLRELCFIHAGLPKAQAQAERWGVEFCSGPDWERLGTYQPDGSLKLLEFQTEAAAELKCLQKRAANPNLEYRVVRV